MPCPPHCSVCQVSCHVRVRLFWNEITSIRRRDSEICIATGYGLNDRGVGVRVPVGSSIIPSPWLPIGLCGLHSLLFNVYRRQFPWR
jgi:hypothetical protein